MVSFWPWKGNDTSPASFEKALSALATKLSKSQTQLDTLRQRGRRLKALWTLYAIFAYLLCFIILFLVVGWQNWSAVEYTAVSGSPLFIYLVRKGITAYYDFRIDTVTKRLEDQQTERTKTIEKLKAATKYNSTQELLEKYGGAPPAPKPKTPKTPSKAPKAKEDASQPLRVGAGPPPPTANIPRPGQGQLPNSSLPSTPQSGPRGSHHQTIQPSSAPSPVGPPEFAPNAFPTPPQYAHSSEHAIGGNWYDRVLDLLLGEDETSPKNRMALICQNCRLINGQAPPGAKTLTEVGKWRCFACGAWNGEEDEAAKAVKEMKKRIEEEQPSEVEKSIQDSVELVSEGEDEDVIKSEDLDSSEEVVEVKPKKGRSKGNKKKM
ncbi:hypothetical protein BGZ60DRAFT_506965 [Tricladium varicosporioides]|nr:hypothetical protein BGZ60DRAFT_506965 [Hymenoscyphus varicosporioides]